MVTTAATFD